MAGGVFIMAWLLPKLMGSSAFSTSSPEYSAFSLLMHAIILWAALTLQYTAKTPTQQPPMQGRPGSMACSPGYITIQDDDASPKNRIVLWFVAWAIFFWGCQLTLRSYSTTTQRMLQYIIWVMEIAITYIIAQSIIDNQPYMQPQQPQQSQMQQQSQFGGGGYGGGGLSMQQEEALLAGLR